MSLVTSMQPHLLSLGFDWSNNTGDHEYFDIEKRVNEAIEPSNCTQRVPSRYEDFHTSLRFTKPTGHPLHPHSRRNQDQRATFLAKGNLERIESNKTWSSDESVCVSSLGIGGWDDDDEHDIGVEADEAVFQGLELPAHTWAVVVGSEESGSAWFKLAKKGETDVLWLEDEEILFFLERIQATAASICIHLTNDDVSAIVPLAQAYDYFATIVSPPDRAQALQHTGNVGHSILSRCLLRFFEPKNLSHRTSTDFQHSPH